MSKDIVIQKDGVPTNVTAEVIRTDGIEGGSVDWVPEDEVQLLEDKEITANGEYVAADEGYYGYKAVSVVGRNKGDIKLISKTIEANGAYRAESDGAYGYSRLSVRVKGGATYTDPDTGETVTPDPSPYDGSTIIGLDNGNETMVTIDNGVKKKTTLPHHIAVDESSELTYADGQQIDWSQTIVKAYNADGSIWEDSDYPNGILPTNELLFSYRGNARFEDCETYVPISIQSHPELTLGEVNKTPYIGGYKEYYNPPFVYSQFYGPYNENDRVALLTFDPYKDTRTNSRLRIFIPSGRHCEAGEPRNYGGGSLIIPVSTSQNYYSVRLSSSNVYYSGEIPTAEEAEARVKSLGYEPSTASFAASAYGKTAYFGSYLAGGSNYTDPLHASSNNEKVFPGEITWSSYMQSHGINQPAIRTLAWYALYGARQKEVGVSWQRPKDSKILSSTFQLTVTIINE